MTEHDLRRLCETHEGPYLRPFAPNPHWKSAKCFVVGENPRTPFRDEFGSFESYWNSLTKGQSPFQNLYSSRHQAGRSKTRVGAEQLVEAVGTEHCLVTNVCWYPAKKLTEVPAAVQGASAQHLLGLIELVRPNVLFFHGRAARAFAHNWLGVDLDPYVPPREQALVRDGVLYLGYHHFTGQGLRRGTRFTPSLDIPEFVRSITAHLSRAP